MKKCQISKIKFKKRIKEDDGGSKGHNPFGKATCASGDNITLSSHKWKMFKRNLIQVNFDKALFDESPNEDQGFEHDWKINEYRLSKYGNTIKNTEIFTVCSIRNKK